jgi:hypothetical protein
MSFSTIAQVRACNEKLSDDTEVLDALVTDRISESDSTVIVDLSSLYDESDLLSLGSSNKVLNLLSTWKACELTLARLYGATRKVDEISDIQYWGGKYDKLLKKVINSEITLSETSDLVSAPVITSSANRLKIFPRKGIEDFEEGFVDDEY